MTQEHLTSMLELGENTAVEFKRCGNGIESDTYETVCSFLNRFGGDIFLGVLDDGTVEGVPKQAATDNIRNFVKMVNNPDIISPTVYLVPEKIVYEGKCIIYIHVPPSSEVHRYKKVIYDRVDDADVRITSTSQIAAMYIRKQNIFTEKKIYPYIKMEHLRLDLLPLCRRRALNKRQNHPWKDMTDEELLKSAGLLSEDFATGEKGFNLAAVMLLGKDEVIQSICPAYKTDALLRKVNKDRYDDREIIKTNLIESYEALMAFAKKHLWDKFYLENDLTVSLRDKITREMLTNMLIHREFTSPYIAKFIIEENQMYAENACRALRNGEITPENLSPVPKNPLIAAFFNQIGNADELGSGTRNLYKYSRLYSGKTPSIIEGDIFKIILPLDDAYSFDAENLSNVKVGDRVGDRVGDKVGDKVGEPDLYLPSENVLTKNQLHMLHCLEENPGISAARLAEKIGISSRKVEGNIKKLKELGILERHGSPRKGYWVIKRD